MSVLLLFPNDPKPQILNSTDEQSYSASEQNLEYAHQA